MSRRCVHKDGTSCHLRVSRGGVRGIKRVFRGSSIGSVRGCREGVFIRTVRHVT